MSRTYSPRTYQTLEERQKEMQERLKAEKALTGRKGRLIVVCPGCDTNVQIFSGRLQQHFMFGKACKFSGRLW